MIKEGNNSKRKLRVLIPDAESEILTEQVKNCFSGVNTIALYLISKKKFVPSRFSRFVKHFSYFPTSDDVNSWIDRINEEVAKYDIDLIMPIYETGIRLLIVNRELVAHPKKLVQLPSLASLDTANNKALLSEHLLKHQIPGPENLTMDPKKAFGFSTSTFPIIAKPIQGSEGGKGIFVCTTAQDFKTHSDNFLEGKDYLYQKFIEGYDIDCSVLCKKGSVQAFTIQRGTLYGKKPFSPAMGLRFLLEPKLLETVKKLMKTLDWSGVAHIDLRYDLHKDEFKVIEVNTRFWTSLGSSLLAGVNFPYRYCLMCMGEPVESANYKHIEVLNLKAVVKKIRKNVFFVFKVGFLFKNTPLKYALKDPLPIVMKFLWRTKNKCYAFLKGKGLFIRTAF